MPSMDCQLRRWACVGVFAAASLAACSDGAAPPLTPKSVTVQGTVRDSIGDPVQGALTMLYIFTPDSVPYWASPPPFAVTNTVGIFAVESDSLGSPIIDSVRIESLAPGCNDPGQVTIIPATEVPPGEAPVLNITITQADVHAPARTAPGQYCAYGIHPDWGPGSYILALAIDSTIADTVWGRWDLNYRFTSADNLGSFVGSATPSLVVLQLTQDDPWNACLAMELQIPVLASGIWGPATIVGAQSCVPEPAPLSFAADTIFGKFP